MHPAIIVLLATSAFAILMILIIMMVVRCQKKAKSTTQRIITDRELIRLISSQSDGFLSAQQLAEETGISVNQAKIRLSALGFKGILKSSYTSRGSMYYELVNPIEEKTPPTMSEEPFLTVDDILALFETYGNRLDFQNLILATDLPLDVLEREMKYFAEQKVVQLLNQPIRYGAHTYKFYLLEEPYRSDPKQFKTREVEMNQKVKELLRSDQLI